MTNSRSLRQVLACLALAALSACSDDSSSRSQLKDFYQFYVTDSATTNNSLTLVDAADLSHRIELGARDGGFVAFYSGETSGGIVRDYRPHSLYLIQDGAWRRVSLRHGGSQQPTQISNEALSAACPLFRIVEPAVGVAEGASLLYKKPGADDQCDTVDDVYRRIGLHDSPTTAPLDGPIGDRSVEFRDADGNLTGLLAYEKATGTLRLYQPDLVANATLDSVAAGSSFQVLNRRDSAALVNYDGAVRRVTAAGLVGPSLYTPSSCFNDSPYVADDTYLYFTDCTPPDVYSLYRVALNGSASAKLLASTNQYSYLSVLGETTASVVLAGDQDVLLVDKTADGTDAPGLLRNFPEASSINSLTQHSPILADTIPASSGPTYAIRIGRNDTLTSTVAADWAGLRFPADIPLSELQASGDVRPVGAFRAEKQVSGGDIVKSLTFATSALTTLFVAPENSHTVSYAQGSVGIGYFGIATEVDGFPQFQIDVFSFDRDDGSVVRHTDGTPDDEYPSPAYRYPPLP